MYYCLMTATVDLVNYLPKKWSKLAYKVGKKMETADTVKRQQLYE